MNPLVLIAAHLIIILIVFFATRAYYKIEIKNMREDSFAAIRKERKEKNEAYNKGFTDGLMALKIDRSNNPIADSKKMNPEVK